LRERFGFAVRRIRKSHGLSQERLALACDLHRTFIGAVERGETNVSLATLGRLAKGLGVSVAQLAAEAESACA
jgi:transcriptional regulator with XRE-family HTH domain